MIIWNGREIAPQKIKRIQLGEKIVYVRRSKMGIKTGFEFDFETDMKNAFSVPMETDMDFLFELASSPDMEVHIISSDVSEIDFSTEIEMEQELYVELTAPMKYDKPIVFVFETEAIAPKAAICETEEQIPIIFEVEANAPTTVGTKATETLGFNFDFVPEANAANSMPLEDEVTVFKLDAKAELKAANAADIDTESVLILGIDSEMQASETISTETNFGTRVEIEAELWIKPGEWVYPVLKKGVLGITQALSTVQSGNIIKIT
ncbi:MAG: hypothetical protein J6J15_01355 [Oscillospiraceae bacterium]|nr:hypothetical protein [Oscillospiraceae bacterium]